MLNNFYLSVDIKNYMYENQKFIEYCINISIVFIEAMRYNNLVFEQIQIISF